MGHAYIKNMHRNVSALEMLHNRALKIDIYVRTCLLTYRAQH